MIQVSLLKNKKTVFLAVGNIMRADDGFGHMIYKRLQKFAGADFLPLDGGELPENMSGKIKAFAPDYLIIADAAFLPQKPAGALELLNEADIINPSLSTHTMPLNIMVKFLKEELPDLKIIFIAANAKNTDFDAPASREIKIAAKTAADIVKKSLRK
ncbi:MAG: hydrogenase maturation protease [Elusimicrobiota bacterium]|jgi:hydrogenase 3 maturation protease|nr:hydrogenase maturation protease [Elusimicrobiota bacterium]